MKDPLDRQTINLLGDTDMAEQMNKYRVNYGYAIKGKLRSGALIIDAKDSKTAAENAKKQLGDEYDWYQINSVKPLV